jgi:Mn2+/Fe2+ NRAMP family transporter
MYRSGLCKSGRTIEFVVFLIVLGVLIVIGFMAVIRHSRNFKGAGQHFAPEGRPDVRLSQGLPRNNDGGGV